MGKRRVVTIPLSPPLSLLVSYLVPVPGQLHTHSQTDMSVIMVDGCCTTSCLGTQQGSDQRMAKGQMYTSSAEQLCHLHMEDASSFCQVHLSHAPGLTLQCFHAHRKAYSTSVWQNSTAATVSSSSSSSSRHSSRNSLLDNTEQQFKRLLRESCASCLRW